MNIQEQISHCASVLATDQGRWLEAGIAVLLSHGIKLEELEIVHETGMKTPNPDWYDYQIHTRAYVRIRKETDR